MRLVDRRREWLELGRVRPLPLAIVSTIGFDAARRLPCRCRCSQAAAECQRPGPPPGLHCWRMRVLASWPCSASSVVAALIAATRHYARPGSRLRPDAPSAEGVGGCAYAREAARGDPGGRRARCGVARVSRGEDPAGSLAGDVDRGEPCARRAPGGRSSAAGRGVGTPAREQVRHPAGGRGPRLVLAPLNNPGVGSALLFTVGLLGYAACPAIVAHAALAYPDGRLTRPARARRARVAYAGSVLLGSLPALVFDPARAGLLECPRQPPRGHERARVSWRPSARRPRARPRLGARARAAGAWRGRALLLRRPAAARAGAAAGRRLPRARRRRLRPRRSRGFLSNDGVDQRPVARAGGRARALALGRRVGVAARAAGAHRGRAARDRAR